ncbi:ribosome recycling factor [Candidatus Collierbacteria bacterium RIFOXYB1_FULL_49_13]|uniref:Ribosome-recycling factor n=1 Tax=Candidatus Collierbacteria bacterium RIFOXYB1_FULL_49_13 TaxID=1817728 RepID=A0A1F5FFB5_9BACT|nr:MAG: ribosome recycling factor [Candidatus Collierbacteria bacterium RIFOXYB1_FULL_49_13]
MEETILNGAKNKFEKVLAVVAEDLATIRVGGAKPSMVENVSVEAYGQRMKLLELANISTPDPQQILIQPWDKSMIRNIEKGIIEANLGLMPNVSGEIVRIMVPPLNEERRGEFVKLAKQKLEGGRILLRQARVEVREDIDHQKEAPGVSEDDIKNWHEKLQKMVDEYGDKLEQMEIEKVKEIMKV